MSSSPNFPYLEFITGFFPNKILKMLPSLSLVYGLITLPAKLAYLTLQFFTVGTVFTNPTAKKSLIKTLHNGLCQHMGRSIRVQDLQLVHVPVSKILGMMSKTLGRLPGYNEKYSDKEEFACESRWLTKNITLKSSPIVLYFHGGCFAILMLDNQAQGMANLYDAYKLRYGDDLSILLADYSLVSEGSTYPSQYNEATSLYEKLVYEGYTNIVLMGDSAGGNLVLNVLSYLHEKSNHHEVVWPVAAIGISPYLNVSKQEFKGSFKKFNRLDFFNYDMTSYFGNLYIGGDEYLNDSPIVNIELNADKVDWKDIPVIKNGDLLIQFGDHEVLTDEILRWCEKAELTSRHPENIAIDIDGTHIGFFVTESVAYGTIENWLNQYCANSLLTFLNSKLK